MAGLGSCPIRAFESVAAVQVRPIFLSILIRISLAQVRGKLCSRQENFS